MKFSVLMSVYRGENSRYLAESLDSVFHQTLRPDEVVLVKDGPLTRDLDQVIDDFSMRYDNLRIVVLTENRGLGFALNAGLAHCSYDIVARMDTDDIAVRERFEKQIAEFERDPCVSLVGSSVAEFENDPRQVDRVRNVPLEHHEIRRLFGRRCPVNHPTVVFLKSAVELAGGYDNKYVQEDYYLWGRMLAKSCIFKNLPEPLVLMRCGAGLYSRRGGATYAVSEARLQKEFYNLGLVTGTQFFVNSVARLVVRAMPEPARRLVYRMLLRNPVRSANA